MKTPKPPKPEKTWPQFVASFLQNDFAGLARQECGSEEEGMKRLPPDRLAPVLKLNFDRFIDRQQLRRIVRYALSDQTTKPDDETLIDMRCASRLLLHHYPQ